MATQLTIEQIRAKLYSAAFDGQDKKWRSASIDADGCATRWECKKGDLVTDHGRGPMWLCKSIYYLDYKGLSNGWDGTQWQKLTINRDDDDEGYQYTIEGEDIDSTAFKSADDEVYSNDIPF